MRDLSFFPRLYVPLNKPKTGLEPPLAAGMKDAGLIGRSDWRRVGPEAAANMNTFES